MASADDAIERLGGKIAGRVAEYLSRVMFSTKEQASGLVVAQAMKVQHEFFELTGSEVRRTVAPVWNMIGNHPDAPDWVKATGQFVAAGKGQWATLLAGTATGAAMGGGLGSLISNELNPIVTAIIANDPNTQLSPAEAAAAKVRGLGAIQDLNWEAARSGVDFERFVVLQELNTTVLAPGEIIELYRRGILGLDDALKRLHRTGFDGHHAKELLNLARTLIGMPDASAMWNRSIIDTEELVRIGVANGYTDDEARKFAELGGEPPPPELLYAAYRRGIIDLDTLRRGIVQGPIRNEWFPLLEQMSMHPMTPEQAASAVTQGHMTIARGRQIAHEYGLNPEDFETIVETSGRPPGVEFAGEALLRGFITEDEFRAMFLESAIKNRYIDTIRKMVTRLVPQETARSLLSKGVITEERTREILRQHGFAPEDIDSLIAASTVERTQAARDLSLSMVQELYTEQEITADDAMGMLQALGYDEQEAGWLLDLADLRRERTYRSAVVTRVRSGFVKGLITEESAVTTLDALGVPPARRDTLLSLWSIEQTTVTRDLTPAQLVQAAKKGIMPPAAAHQRLVGQGYASEDATVLLGLSGVTVS